jgi:hypothetical protein
LIPHLHLRLSQWKSPVGGRVCSVQKKSVRPEPKENWKNWAKPEVVTCVGIKSVDLRRRKAWHNSRRNSVGQEEAFLRHFKGKLLVPVAYHRRWTSGLS